MKIIQRYIQEAIAPRKKAKLFIYPESLYAKYEKNNYDKDMLIPYLQRKYAPQMKRGDVASPMIYRNQGSFIFDGKQLVDLYYAIDDYGSVPPSFFYPEFPLRYWGDNEISHNYIRWVHKRSDIGQKILKSKLDTIEIDGVTWEIKKVRWYHGGRKRVCITLSALQEGSIGVTGCRRYVICNRICKNFSVCGW